jgi:outer membrane receptor protein involved in Fe transport
MRPRSVLALTACLLVQTQTEAHSQSATAGAISGVITDQRSGEPLPGIPIEITSTSLLGNRSAFTDDLGAYKVTDLPPGEYVVTFFYDNLTLKRAGIVVGVRRTTPVFQSIDTASASGEVVEIEDAAPAIDPTSTSQGITLDGQYFKNLPIAGRTFADTIGAAPGAQADRVGPAFSGSTSLENQYNIDGINTTALGVGSVGSSVINDFIEETEVITGGYNAEYGRATGAVINVATKSGSNILTGSVFGYLTPGVFSGAVERTENQGTSIDSYGKLAYDSNVGFEVGGPIVRDKLFFFVGMAPRVVSNNITRITKRQIDCRAVDLATGRLRPQCDPRSVAEGGLADGDPDRDPETRLLLYEDIDREIRVARSSGYSGIGKLNFAWSPENQGQVSFLIDRNDTTVPGISGLPSSGRDTTSLNLDGAAKWTAKLNDNKTEIEVILGWHRADSDSDSNDDQLNGTPSQLLVGGALSDYANFGAESQLTRDRCSDAGEQDDYPQIVNCPIDAAGYAIGGPGAITRVDNERRTARLGFTQRFRARGGHEVKAGVDLEQNLRNAPRLLSGGASIQNQIGEQVTVNRWVKLAPPDGDALFADECRAPANDGTSDIRTLRCAFLGGQEGDFGTGVSGETLNWSMYFRDSWQLLPNLTVNAGVRYEEQRLRYSKELRSQIDPLTNRQVGTNAMVLTGQWAPRLGILYDWTREGRSKVYAHWGRFYESIPLDINDRSFGGEVGFRQDFSPALCLPPGGVADPRIGGPDGLGCVTGNKVGDLGENLVGASGSLIAPGIEGQYIDETLAGVEYEILADLTIGVALQTRRVGRVIEDLSTDGANTYLIANPGSFSQEQERALVEQIARTDAPDLRQRLEHDLELYRGIRSFDKPQRDYTAVTITAQRRFSRSLYLQASYTYSRTRGNYPGTLSSDNNQIDPNISSQYDLIELLGNRRGPLPQDRPHALKVDGYYTFDLANQGSITVGTSFRALSGVPINALGAHYAYGPNEAFLLPRGILGRSAFDHNVSTRVSYARGLGRGMAIEVFADVFNLYNRQASTRLDEAYAPATLNNNTSPISGGSYEDLIWLKRQGSAARGGLETTADETDAAGKPYGPAIGNLNFRNATTRSPPISMQFGMRLTF